MDLHSYIYQRHSANQIWPLKFFNLGLYKDITMINIKLSIFLYGNKISIIITSHTLTIP